MAILTCHITALKMITLNILRVSTTLSSIILLHFWRVKIRKKRKKFFTLKFRPSPLLLSKGTFALLQLANTFQSLSILFVTSYKKILFWWDGSSLRSRPIVCLFFNVTTSSNMTPSEDTATQKEMIFPPKTWVLFLKIWK